MALVLAQALPDVPAERIFEEVLHIRPQVWPNLRILEIGDAMLGRRGELVAAAAGVYRTQLDRRQYLVPPVIDSAGDFRIDGSAMTEMHRDRATSCCEEVCGEAQR
jgi:hypothetical protein